MGSAFSFRKAERRQSKLRLGITGTAGSGKTYSALKIAFGLGGSIGLIDTENGSGDLYEDLGDYSVLPLGPPFSPDRYIQAIKAGEDAGLDIIIIDSLSHAWAGTGGVLDILGKAVDASSSKNSYTAWRTVTPKHNALVEAMLQSRCHIIATMRSKAAYAMDESESGKSKIRKLGLQPVQREGMDYEFTVVFDLSDQHVATCTKDRTSLFPIDEPFLPDEETGLKLLEWLNTGKPPLEPTIYSLEELKNLASGCKTIQELHEWYRTRDVQMSEKGLTDEEKDGLKTYLTSVKQKIAGGAKE